MRAMIEELQDLEQFWEVAVDAFKSYAEEELVTIRKYQVSKS
jgi:hypothetical protein